ncbi:aminotransferase class I/II-fold pyridoxal phosphate-dependent enzyme [Novosphingobium capsulatum]|uniref:aminotransferase class I/II-fold pyridoxal phosphate-dependent enzyme n=1 Tax=Novosphingobium capsulatum TaxID=13688 RepID=UPI00078944A9|nr:aminotransferase class I/II-fold pyridoxal phosphate-dependent enzyme [Novosphingobium capsulatum]WQD94904.1 aminotransferase class I/II-fold pyridoxal phosphate-dependent enzyme [Novosphingobium capsulatum]
MNRFTWHGGGLAAARAQFGDGPWLDLSTGINPCPWPQAGALAAAVDWQALPDESALRGLEQAAAARFGCAADHVCAVPGTEIGLRLVGDLIGGGGCHAVPGYRTHAAMLRASVAVDDLAQAHGTSLVLANPNNPDGRLLTRAMLRNLLHRRGDNGWLLLDEAFADAHPQASLAGDIADAQRLVIFRSFGKFFGLAGLRLGFVLGPRALLAALRAQLGAWPLCAAALAVGEAAYRDAIWIADARAALQERAARLDAVLRGKGYTVGGACPLFRLVRGVDGAALFDHLAQQHILTRPFADQPDWLRLGLPGDAAGLARLVQALPSHG